MKNYRSVFVVAFLALAALPLSWAYDWDNDVVVGELQRPDPNAPSAISQAVDQAIAEQRQMWKDYHEYLAGWFDREAMPGHSIKLLPTGRDSFAARLELIDSATTSIYLSAYAFSDDDAASRIIFEHLCQKAQSIEVRLLLDGHGAQRFKAAGWDKDLFECGGYVFFDTQAHGSLSDLPYVIHEKLLIVDGKRYIIGGSGYGEHYLNASRFNDKWHDLDALISGPSACWFHRKFVDNWKAMTKRAVNNHVDAMGGGGMSEDAQEHFYGNSSLVDCEEVVAGTSRVLPRHNNPLVSSKRPNLAAHLSAVAASSKTIVLYAPYFVPGKKMVQALTAKALQGVKVTVITNSKKSTDDTGLIFLGMYDRVKPMMDAGVEIRMWNRTNTMHRKGGLYDGKWAYFGSDNQDNRGQDWSSESIAFTDDAAIIAQYQEEIRLDLEQTFKLTPELISAHRRSFSWIKKVFTGWIEDML